MNLASPRCVLLALAVAVPLLAPAPKALAEKIWTNDVSGLWSNGQNWSGHSPPDINSFIRITNDNSKVITIDANTASTNLTVQKLTLSAPPGATNTLLLSGLGAANPLVFQTGLEMLDGAAIRVTNSTLQTLLTNDHINIDGMLTLDSGLIDFGDITVTARVGRVTSGALTINGGSVSAGVITVGGLTNSSGLLGLNGGLLQVASFLSVGRSLGTTGLMSVAGGQLLVTNNDTRVGDEGTGQMILSNATATLNNLQVGRNGLGTVYLQAGGSALVLNDSVIGRFSSGTGVVYIAGGQITSPGQKLYVGRGGSGQLNLSGGGIELASMLVAADTTNSIGASGIALLSGGSLILHSNLVVGSFPYSTGQVYITGSLVAVTNPAFSGSVNVSSGSLNLGGGVLLVNSLIATNSSGLILFAGGTLSSGATTINNGSPFVVGDGIAPAEFRLNGGTHTFANGLVISSNATLTGCGTVLGAILNHGTISTNCGTSPVAPAITAPPQNQTVMVGSNVNLTVLATGTAPLFYQWKFAGTNLAGGTASAYPINNVQPAQSGNYTVIVTNLAGSATTTDSLKVLSAVVIEPPAFSGTTNSISFASTLGVTYTLQYKNTLSDPLWTPLPPSASGTGGIIVLYDPAATVPTRFYRVVAQ